MLTSLALIFLVGMLLGSIFSKLRLPSLLGMLSTGLLLGPYALNLIDDSILSISTDLRQLALVIILLRGGLSLNLDDLKRAGRPAILMCFIPACFEIIGMIWLAPKIMGISILEAAVLGSVVAAVSPAVVVPRMIKLIEQGYGTDKSIPQLIMAGASVDDVFVIVLFSSFLSLAGGENISAMHFFEIPAAILFGIIAGVFFGWLLSFFFRKIHMHDSAKVLILLSVAFLLVAAEKRTSLPFSGLLAVMAIGIAFLRFHPILAPRLSSKFSKLWIPAELLLFALVGATVDIRFAASAGSSTTLLLLLVLCFRMAGVLVCLSGRSFNRREKLFCIAAYIPKATVQAAIGGIPLAMGLSCGNLVLTVAALSILITAPLGAFCIDFLYKRCLQKS